MRSKTKLLESMVVDFFNQSSKPSTLTAFQIQERLKSTDMDELLDDIEAAIIDDLGLKNILSPLIIGQFDVQYTANGKYLNYSITLSPEAVIKAQEAIDKFRLIDQSYTIENYIAELIQELSLDMPVSGVVITI